MKKLLVLLVMLVLFVGACNTQQGQSTSEGRESEEEEPKADTKLQQKEQAKNKQAAEELRLGDSADLPGDGTITVYTYTSPVQPQNQFQKTKAGEQFAVIDVEGCAGNAPVNINMFFFHLQMPDNTRLNPGISVAEPALNSADLQPGDCLRGYVTFSIPEGSEPTMVLYIPPGNSAGARWAL